MRDKDAEDNRRILAAQDRNGPDLLGIALLCQPFTVVLYAWRFPTMLVVVILFIVADHWPLPKSTHSLNNEHR